MDQAREAGCYKVILDCSDSNVKFYEKCGFQKKEVQMVRLQKRNSYAPSQAYDIALQPCWHYSQILLPFTSHKRGKQ